MARYKAIPSKKEELDAFWDDLMTECGCNSRQKAEISANFTEYKQKSAQFMAICDQEAKAGRQPGQSLEDFKKHKLRSLDIIAQTVNELVE